MKFPSRTLFAAATLVAATALHAAPVTWDITPGTIGAGDSAVTGGAGTWNDSLAGTPNGNWTTDGGVNNVAWVNANNDTAIFGGTAGTVTLGNAITAGGLTFNTAGYTLTGSTLTFGGATPTILMSAAGTIGSAINTGGLTVSKSGASTLTLSGNTFTGGGIFDITAGRVNTTGTVALGTTNLKVGNGNALVIGSVSGGITGGSITLGIGSQLSFQNGGAGSVTSTSNIALNAGTGSANAAQIGGFIFGNNTTLSGTISGTGDLRWVNGILGGGSNQANLNAGSSTTGWAANSYVGATSFEGTNLNFNLTSNANNATITPFGATGNAVTANAGATLHFNTTGSANNTSIIANAMSFAAANGQTTTLYREDGNLRFTGNIDVTTTGTGKVVFKSKWGQVTSKGLKIEGVLSGSGNISISRADDTSEDGSVHLTNNGNTFNGTISVDSTGGNAGRLVLEANGAAANASVNLAVSGAQLNINTTNATVASLTGVAGSQISVRTAGQTLTVNQSVNTTFAGVLGASSLQNTGGIAGLNFVKSGTGTLTLSGANLHTGGTTVNGGTLTIAATTGSIRVGAAGVTVASGATLTVNGTLNLTTNLATIANAGTINGTGIINIGTLFDGDGSTHTYNLISGAGALDGANFTVTGFANYSSVTFDKTTGNLVFTAVPEPSTYGLLGAGAFAAGALVRRRRKAKVAA